MKKTKRARTDRLVMAALALKDALGRRGMWSTYHKMDAVIQRLGWEIAGHKTESPYEKTRS